MYNRYIPQPDGSYRRNRLPDTERDAPGPPGSRGQPGRSQLPDPAQGRTPPQEPGFSPQTSPPPNRSGRSWSAPRQPSRPAPSPPQPTASGGVMGFLRQLLPRDFDTEDLLIVLLLLLMSGDCKEDQNTALLTLALYFFM